MRGWWRRNPHYVGYMLRETSSLFIAAYAVILLVGLYRLTQGEAAYEAWRESLTQPLSIAFHWFALLFTGYHAASWWQVAPRTLPDLRIARWPLSAKAVTAAGWLATLTASAAVYSFVRWM
jgi:fumarate reductase subunit C